MFPKLLIAIAPFFLRFFSSSMAYVGQSIPAEIKAEFSQCPGSEVIKTIAQGEFRDELN